VKEQLSVKVEKLAYIPAANQLSTACTTNQERGTLQRKRLSKILHKNLLQSDKFKRNVSEVPKQAAQHHCFAEEVNIIQRAASVPPADITDQIFSAEKFDKFEQPCDFVQEYQWQPFALRDNAFDLIDEEQSLFMSKRQFN
jgi:hypothetical protein